MLANEDMKGRSHSQAKTHDGQDSKNNSGPSITTSGSTFNGLHRSTAVRGSLRSLPTASDGR